MDPHRSQVTVNLELDIGDKIEEEASKYVSPQSSGSYDTARDSDFDEEEGEKKKKEEEEDDEGIFLNGTLVDFLTAQRWLSGWVLIQYILLLSAIVFFLASFLVDGFKGEQIWGLELWRWCLLVAAIFCRRLASDFVISTLVILIKRNFLFKKKKVLYIVYGLKESLGAFMWLFLICLSLYMSFVLGACGFVSQLLISLVIGSALWNLKTLLVQKLASAFQISWYFDRVKESIFHQYMMQTLSGPPLVGDTNNSGKLIFRIKGNRKVKGKGREKHGVVDISKLYRTNQEKISAWTMEGLVKVIRFSTLAALVNGISVEGEKKEREIRSEDIAKHAAFRIFDNVAKPNSNFIGSDDLLRFMSKEEVEYGMTLFEGLAKTEKINRSDFINWMVKAYHNRKSLAQSLDDMKNPIKQVDKLAKIIIVVVVLNILVILSDIATTNLMFLVSSVILATVFVFGNTCKVAFEGMIFVFATHPYDVGDWCVIDDIPMLVNEINIMTTVFLKINNEKVFCPNSVLATKMIINFERSPVMRDVDTVEFFFSASNLKSIGDLRAMIKMYIDNNPDSWHPKHNLVVKGKVDAENFKMALQVNHKFNYQDIDEKENRRSELVIELERIVEELKRG